MDTKLYRCFNKTKKTQNTVKGGRKLLCRHLVVYLIFIRSDGDARKSHDAQPT